MKEKELMEPSVALRHLADNVGFKWLSELRNGSTGLGHLHDIWREMYDDMEAIVCLEKFIEENDENGGGCYFLPVKGFDKYNKSEE